MASAILLGEMPPPAALPQARVEPVSALIVVDGKQFTFRRVVGPVAPVFLVSR